MRLIGQQRSETHDQRSHQERLSERILEADIRASQYLGDYNEVVEASGSPIKAERLYAKSQYWLDRYNKLTGNA